MPWGSWIAVACFALVLPATCIQSTAAARASTATSLVRIAAPPTECELTDASPTDNDDDAPDLDDSDNDDEDALLASAVTIAPPLERGAVYRTPPRSSYEPPHSKQLLRPPQRYVD